MNVSNDETTSKSSRSGLRFVAMKLSLLLTFCGGPLLFAQDLEGKLAPPLPFVLGFLPVGIFALGVLTLRDGVKNHLDRLIHGCGLSAAFLVVLMNFYAAIRLVNGAGGKDRGLIGLGIVVGFVSVALYFDLARKARQSRIPPMQG